MWCTDLLNIHLQLEGVVASCLVWEVSHVHIKNLYANVKGLKFKKVVSTTWAAVVATVAACRLCKVSAAEVASLGVF